MTTDKEKKTAEKNILKNQDLEDLKWVLSTRQGRRFMWKLLEGCNIFKSCFTGNSSTFYNEGRRDVGLEVFNKVVRFQDSYLEMQKENTVKEN